MTPWLRLPRRVLLCCVALAVCTQASSGAGESECWSPSITSCTDCLRRGPQCAWCFKENFHDGLWPGHRCDLPLNLLRRGCGPEFLEQSEVKVEVDATVEGTQVSPADIGVTLTPGSEASFIVAVKQLERYPVDLYYLVDVSASMQENLDHLKTVGVALSLRMTDHSSDLWLGFGSFVDKPVSPYINVHPSKINNPCSDYEIRCRPAHGFHHVLSVTGNMSEFTRVIKRQRISGNMDTPEGGLDAMLQAAVCQGAIGWRPEAKRLLLLMTDQPSHLALDSRLAGIVTPHDGLCHLENNVYTGSTRMDHPSVGQLSDKLLENNIYSIFAVEKQQYQWYEELVRLLPGSYLGKLGLFQASNLIELVVDSYKRLLSEVAVVVSVEDEAVGRYWATVSPICPEGATVTEQKCSGVRPGQTVYFNITVGLRSCPEDGKDEDVRVTVRPVGYNESTVVRVHSKCQCSCGPSMQCHEDDLSPCAGTQDGVSQEQRLENGQTKASDRESRWKCRADGSDEDCSGRGECDCGRCVCQQSRLGTVYGKHCERDDFSCPYEGGRLCGGRGACVLGECLCDDGWTGESCACPVSEETCQSADGLLCSGHGRCVCGECLCDLQYSGEFCQRCLTCHVTCQTHGQCGGCRSSHSRAQKEAGPCNNTCAPLKGYAANTSECSSGGGGGGGSSSSSSSRLIGTFLSVCALTVLCGLVMVAMSRLILQRKRNWSPGGAVEDGAYRCTGKICGLVMMNNTSEEEEGEDEGEDGNFSRSDLSYIPTTNEKTVSYRRDHPPDRPVEMHIQVPKMPLGDPWQF